MISAEALPLVDEHTIAITAGPDRVWAALGRTLARLQRPATVGARLLGAQPARAAGDPLQVGSCVPGFEVVRAEPTSALVLVGRHRFAGYALTFTLDAGAEPGIDPGAASTVLRAETRAVFPGTAGRAYRTLVIGSGAHVLVTRRMLAGVRRTAERVAAES